MNLVPAKIEDSETLTRLAMKSKAHWGYPETWLKRWQSELTVSPELIADGIVRVCWEFGVAVGFYAFVAEGDTAALEHFWVLPSHMGKGIGRHMFDDAVAEAKSRRCARIVIEADPHSEGFYARMGARRSGTRTYLLDGKERSLPIMKFDLETERSDSGARSI